jgi:hypothetical protein
MSRILLCAVLLLVAPLVATAQEAIMSIDLNKLSWLVGNWQGEAFGGICEESWTAASGGTMSGTFKLIHSDKATTYELMIIGSDSTGSWLRLKHFNPDFSGWEEKDAYVTFPFLSQSEQSLEFDGLTYRLRDDGMLEINVVLGNEDGSTHTETIVCSKQ